MMRLPAPCVRPSVGNDSNQARRQGEAAFPFIPTLVTALSLYLTVDL